MAKTGSRVDLVIWLVILIGIGLVMTLYIINGVGALEGEPMLPSDATALTVSVKAKPNPAGYVLVVWEKDSKDEGTGVGIEEYAIARKPAEGNADYTIIGYAAAGVSMFADSNTIFGNAKMPPNAYLEDGKGYLYQIRAIAGQKNDPIGEIEDRYPEPKTGVFYLDWQELIEGVDMDSYYAITVEWLDENAEDPEQSWQPVPNAKFSNKALGAAVTLGAVELGENPITFRVMGMEPSEAPNISKDMEEAVTVLIPPPLTTICSIPPNTDGGRINVTWLPSGEEGTSGGDVWEYAVYRAPTNEEGELQGEYELKMFTGCGETRFSDHSAPEAGYIVPNGQFFTYQVRAFDYSSTAEILGELPPQSATENRLEVNLAQLPGYAEAADEDGFLCYTLERSSDGLSYQKISTMASPLGTYVDVKVDAGKTYYYRVQTLSWHLGEFFEIVTTDRLDPQAIEDSEDTFMIPVDWSKKAVFEQASKDDTLFKLRIERAEWADDLEWETVALIAPAPGWVDTDDALDTEKEYLYRISALLFPSDVALPETQALEATAEGISFTWMPPSDGRKLKIERSEVSEVPDWQTIAVLPSGTVTFTDTVDSGLVVGTFYQYRISSVPLYAIGASSAPIAAEATWFNWSMLPILILLLTIAVLVLFYIARARRGRKLFIRRITGLEAVQEAVGRATEMGKSILYVPGIGAISDLQTIASLVILGRVARMVADYEAKIVVPCNDPIVMSVAQETVKEAYSEAGRPDSFRADSVRYITTEQFAYVAGVDGIMLRDKPAATFFLGTFYAESLILAETGFSIGAIQIAGTAMPSQIPFFVVACDYTLIGEELYAASAYLSREPRLLGSLLGQDWGKVIAILLVLVFSAAVTVGYIIGLPDKPPGVDQADYLNSLTPTEKLAWTLNNIDQLIIPGE